MMQTKRKQECLFIKASWAMLINCLIVLLPQLANAKECAQELQLIRGDAVPLDYYLNAMFCSEVKVRQLFQSTHNTTPGKLAEYIYQLTEAQRLKCHISERDSNNLFIVTGSTRTCVEPQGQVVFGSNLLLNLGILHKFIDGHNEITQQSFKEFCVTNKCKVTEFALTTLGDASEDADYYEWRTEAAHAQTPLLNATGSVYTDSRIQEFHERNFRRWIIKQLSRARGFCKQKNPDFRSSLYFLGYSMHAVQDLSSHRGRTNAEHSFNAIHPEPSESLVDCTPKDKEECATRKKEPCGNPDADQCNVELGKAFSIRFLKAARAYLNRGPIRCFDRALAEEGSELLNVITKYSLHRHTWDLSLEEKNIYENLGPSMNELSPETRKKQARRWFNEGLWDAILGRLEKAILTNEGGSK